MKNLILKWLRITSAGKIEDLESKISKLEEDIELFKKLLKIGVDVHMQYPHS
jgi:hypothetical protein